MLSHPQIAVPGALLLGRGRGTAFSVETRGFHGGVPLSRLLGHGTWDTSGIEKQ
jgi:hypothetical protein